MIIVTYMLFTLSYLLVGCMASLIIFAYIAMLYFAILQLKLLVHVVYNSVSSESINYVFKSIIIFLGEL